MSALRIVAFACSVTFCFANKYLIQDVGKYEGCPGSCNYFFSPIYQKPEAIRGYCVKGLTQEPCLKRYDFYLTMKLCCDDISFNMDGSDAYRVDYYNSVVVMYGYYVLDYLKPTELWNKKDAKVDEIVKSSVIPFYPQKDDDPYPKITVLYATENGKKCLKKTYKLGMCTADNLWFDYKVFFIKKEFKMEETIPCTTFEAAREEYDCVDCFVYEKVISVE